MRQVVLRTLKRGVLRQELWNGNREHLRDIFSRDPDRSIILWSWSMHEPTRQRYRASMADARWADIRFVRLCSTMQVRRFLESVHAELPGQQD